MVERRTQEREVGGSKPCVLEQETILPESTVNAVAPSRHD